MNTTEKFQKLYPPHENRKWPALLGNSAGVINAGNGLVYVQTMDGQTLKLPNRGVPKVPQPVLIGYTPDEPDILQVLSEWSVYSKPNTNYLIDHHENHEYPNWDTVWIKLEQIKWLLCLPAGGFDIQVYGGVVLRDGVYTTVSNQVLNIGDSVPDAGARWVLIESDSSGVVSAVDGSPLVDDKLLLTNTDIPPVTSGSFPLCAVAVYDGQDILRRGNVINDFIDLRFTGINATASDLQLDTSAFGGLLSVADDTIQKVADNYDDHTHPAHDQNASTIIIPSSIGTPTYDDLQDFLNMTQASGRLTGGVLTAHAGPDGTLDISEMEGMIHTANTLGSPLIYFKKAAVASIALTDLAVNYIWVTYSSGGGGTLTYSANPARPTDDYNVFVVGRVFRNGNAVEVVTTGQNIFNMYGRAQDRMVTKYGAMDHAQGSVLGAHATALRLSVDAGIWYFGNSRIDTGAVSTFTVLYQAGSTTWLESGALTLFSAIFDGAAATVYASYQNGTAIGTLTANHYGVYWVFQTPAGHLHVVLGTASYANIGLAQAATVPSSLPPEVVNWGILIGRIIIKKSAAAFYSVESSFATQFTLSAVVDHASLANLDYASAAHTGFVPEVRTITATSPITIGGTTSADLSADRTIAIVPATALVPGSMSAADFTKLTNVGIAFKASLAADQTLTNAATLYKIQCVDNNLDSFDTNGFYDNTNYRFTPTVAGKYIIGFVVIADPITAGKFCQYQVYMNGTGSGLRPLMVFNYAVVTPQSVCLSVSEPVTFNGTTDYVELYGYNQEAGKNCLGGTTYPITVFYGWKL